MVSVLSLFMACTPLALEAQKDSGSPGDTEREAVPGRVEGLCTLTLECPEAIPDEPKIDCWFEVEDGGGLSVFDGEAGVELRGRSSSGFDKKQYALELRDGDEDIEIDLLGMGAESDWVLNGAWIDRAFLRNKVGFDLFQSWGDEERYAPESRNCTLRLNNQWIGIYFLSERIKRDAARIDIPPEGSMVLKLDDREGVWSNEAVGYGHWRVVHPNEPTTEEVISIQTWIQGWHEAVRTEEGIFDFIDRSSAIDFLLLQEFLKNNDAYYLSVHLWRERDGRAFFTPWDLDLSFGQPTYNDSESPLGWILYRPIWVQVMAQSEGFSEDMAARWFELRAGELSEEAVLARVDAQVEVYADVVDRNFEVWPWDEIDFLGGYLPVVEDYDQELANIRAWIPARLEWMDASVADY